MKTRNILIICTAFLVSMPCADAQSFKDGLKSIGDKIGKQIVKTTQSVKNQTTGSKPTTSKPTTQKSAASKTSDRDKALQKQYDAMMGNVPEMEDEAPTVKLPDEHTALFAPLGYPVEAAYGTLTVKPSMPPQSPDAQVNWSGKQPNIFNLKRVWWMSSSCWMTASKTDISRLLLRHTRDMKMWKENSMHVPTS